MKKFGVGVVDDTLFILPGNLQKGPEDGGGTFFNRSFREKPNFGLDVVFPPGNAQPGVYFLGVLTGRRPAVFQPLPKVFIGFGIASEISGTPDSRHLPVATDGEMTKANQRLFLVVKDPTLLFSHSNLSNRQQGPQPGHCQKHVNNRPSLHIIDHQRTDRCSLFE